MKLSDQRRLSQSSGNDEDDNDNASESAPPKPKRGAFKSKPAASETDEFESVAPSPKRGKNIKPTWDDDDPLIRPKRNNKKANLDADSEASTSSASTPKRGVRPLKESLYFAQPAAAHSAAVYSPAVPLDSDKDCLKSKVQDLELHLQRTQGAKYGDN